MVEAQSAAAAAQMRRSFAEVAQTSRTVTGHTGWPLEPPPGERKGLQRVLSQAERMGSQMVFGPVLEGRTGLQLESEPVQGAHTGSHQPGRQVEAADSRQVVPEKAGPEKLFVMLSLVGERLAEQCSSESPA